jgi:hypothetical protein
MVAPRESCVIMNTEARIRAIKVLIEKGDKATEKAQDYYVSAGQHLKTLKGQSASAAVWEKLIKAKLGVGKSRAYELLAIADGRTTVADVRLSGKARQAKSIAKLKSKVSVSDGETRALTVIPGGIGQDDDGPGEQTTEAQTLRPATDAELRARAREREHIDEIMRVEAERLAEKLLKTDIESSGALYAILGWPDPRVVAVLRQALEQGLGGADAGQTVEEQIIARAEARPAFDDGLDIPPSLRRH